MDAGIIIASIIELCVSISTGAKTPGISALRLIRVFRVIRLIGMFERLATLVDAFVCAMKQVAWVRIVDNKTKQSKPYNTENVVPTGVGVGVHHCLYFRYHGPRPLCEQ